MAKIVLQTKNVDSALKEKAEKRAKADGFSSIHDVIRIFIKDYSESKISLDTGWELNDKDREDVRDAIDDYKKNGPAGIINKHTNIDTHIDKLLSD